MLRQLQYYYHAIKLLSALLTCHVSGRPVCVGRYGLLVVPAVRLGIGDEGQGQYT